MNSILKQNVLTYKVQMTGEYLYCNRFENKKNEYLIGRFEKDDESFYFFEHEVIQSFKCEYTKTILESRKLYSRYAIVKNEFNKDIKLSKNVMYKISGNKIEPLI